MLYKIQAQRTKIVSGNACRNGILRALAYFDIFHYPLTCDEIRRYLNTTVPEDVFLENLRMLLEEETIYCFNGFCSMQNNPLLVHRRRKGNQRAERLLVKAKRIGRFLGQFPFVSAVAISGSLSKHYADPDADFDFFIITKPGRLWIARTLMHLYKKGAFLRGREHFYCMNYYLDESALSLADRNIFTAIELKTLAPVYGHSILKKLDELNDWTDQYLPNARNDFEKKSARKGFLKKMGEVLFGFSFLDNWFFRITSKRWKKKESRQMKNGKGIPMGLICEKHSARSNPGGFQERILEEFGRRIFLFPADYVD